MTNQMMILIAGPYRSGTDDDPVLIQRNVDAMEDMALNVFRAAGICRCWASGSPCRC
jgi:hypothetical protein